MPLPGLLRRRNRTLTVFVCLMAALVGTLGALAWQLLERDREAERAQIQDRLELTADRVVSALLARFGQLGGLAPGQGTLPADVVVMSGSPTDLRVHPQGRLLFYAQSPRSGDPPPAALAAAEAAEFRNGDPGSAVRLYEAAARSGSTSVRGAALAGLGRTLRHAGRPDEALEAYRALAGLGLAPVLGLPAELLAREGRCSVLAERGRRAELEREATEMADALWGRRYVLTSAAWRFHLEEAIRFGARGARDDARNEAMALSQAAMWAYDACMGDGRTAGRRHALTFEGHPALVMCGAGTAEATDAVVAGPAYVRSLVADRELGAWLSQAGRDREGFHVALVDSGRQVAAGSLDRSRQLAVRTPDATTLPWTVYVSAAEPVGGSSLAGGRRRLFLAGFGVLGLALATGSYFIVRSLQRERAVAALQTDFVSAVSHEFRTPLTSLCQLSEMLAAGRIVADPERAQSYAILVRESRRLDRLVESLLDFGRLEAGTHAYRVERLAAADLVAQVVAEFRASPSAAGFTIDLVQEDDAVVRVDRESLGLALRNMLDNAVKYSGDGRTVQVRTGRENGSVTISVTDDGIGMPSSEHHRIFDTFVRGSGARTAGVRGTGLGLALARRIVAAHGGEIRVASEPGCGSTFTIVLPAEGSS